MKELKARLADIETLHSALALIEWDQQVLMPEGAASARAKHIGTITRMAHEAFVADETARLLESAQPESETDEAYLRVARHDYAIKARVPAALAAEKAALASEAHEVWVSARKSADFAMFAPYLERMVEICRSEAEAIGYEHHIYDALLDQYEEGATTAEAKEMFEAIKGPLTDLVRRITEQPAPNDSFLHGDWDTESQSAFTEHLARQIGFDFEHGRQDTAPHPFCTSFSSSDVRITTRFQEFLSSAIFGTLHEAGHGVYEQGSPPEFDDAPLRGGAGLGVHESQSRLWENIVGRSLPFWERYYPELQARFPELQTHTLQEFHRAVNKVEPSLIRVEADEVTYNLHVLVRFELELDLLTGDLAVGDLPDAWNAKYRDYLGIEPPTDADGVLQDVHWSAALIGYFPTYSMGNLLSYGIWETLKSDLGDTDELIRRGKFEPILQWLQQKVYSKARSLPPSELIVEVTGSPRDAEPYLAGITAKYEGLYGL